MQRNSQLDAMRGLCMALVVFGHAIIGLANGDLLTFTPGWKTLILFLYAFHMPVFFWLSGMVAREASKPLHTVLKSWSLYLIYPYFLWSGLLVALQILMPGASNSEASWTRLITILWDPISPFWFLHTLILIKAIDYTLNRLFPGKTDKPLLAIFLISLTIADTSPLSSGSILYHVLMGGSFYMLGKVMASPTNKFSYQEWTQTLSKPFRAPFLALAGFWGLAMLAAYQSTLPEAALRPLWSFQQGILLTGTLGIVATIALIQILNKHLPALQKLLVIAGLASMAIYVQHVFFSAAVRFALLKAGIPMLPLGLILITLTGIALPILWQYIADKLRITPLFGIRPIRKA